MIIEIENYKCPIDSNLKRKNHWIVKLITKDEIKKLVYDEAIKNKKLLIRPVNIRVVAHYKDSRSISACNLYVNPIISGLLKARLFENEDIEWIATSVVNSAPKDKIIIYINENK